MGGFPRKSDGRRVFTVEFKRGVVQPLLKGEKVGAYNWGFVNGKSQTIYPWDSWEKAYTAEPPVWFHDIFRKDGTPYDAKEVALIRQLTR